MIPRTCTWDDSTLYAEDLVWTFAGVLIDYVPEEAPATPLATGGPSAAVAPGGSPSAPTGAGALDAGEEFEADYARLGAQRNAKIVGVFTRLWKRDGKPGYLPLIPRVWALMERDLSHPALAPVAEWFEANVPGTVREELGGKLG